MTRTLTRAADGIIAGVCAGLAVHLNLSAFAVRAAMAALSLAGGAGILLYIWLWVLVPGNEQVSRTAVEDPLRDPAGSGSRPPAFPRSIMTLGGREVLLGVGLLLAAAVLMAQQFGASIRWDSVVPIAVVLMGAVLVWMQLDQTRRAGLVNRAGADNAGGLARIGAGLILVIIGVLVMVSAAGEWELMWSSVLASLAVLAGVGLVLAPWALKF